MAIGAGFAAAPWVASLVVVLAVWLLRSGSLAAESSASATGGSANMESGGASHAAAITSSVGSAPRARRVNGVGTPSFWRGAA